MPSKLVLFSLAAISLLMPAKTLAANRGITVSPAFQQITVKQGEAQTPVNFTLTNNEAEPQSLSLSVADFGQLEETGGLFFIGSSPTQIQQKYGLAQWFSLPQSNITLQPKQSLAVKAAVLNLPTLAPGGHYGALNIKAVSKNSNPNSSNIALQSVASSLMFVSKIGGDTHIMRLKSVGVSHSLFALPSAVKLEFTNAGNTHVIPRGYINIANQSGNIVSKGIINDNSGLILPQTSRGFTIPLTQLSSASFLGSRYKLLINYRFDGYDTFRNYQSSLFVLNPRGLLLLIFAAVIILLGLKNKTRLVNKIKRAGSHK